MTPIEYAVRGRWILWGAASANMYWELTDDEGDYLTDALAIAGWGMATGALIVPEIGSSIVGWVGTKAAQTAAPIIGRVAMFTAPFAAGYMIGATVGTAISYAIWGEEGAQVALGAYSFGMLPGTEAADVSDFQYIFKPTAPGGPVSLYDLAETGVKTSVVLAKKFWRSTPGYDYRRRGSPYLM
jgi:hypothetical protein